MKDLRISQKNCNFATVIELDRHIEILLLSNDCVIVPGLGGFMAHHVCARYDGEERLFLPPLRTLGFNEQLSMNDSLLVQSYIEVHDCSYPEALRRIEAEVAELKQYIDNDGYYELNGIGVLSRNVEGNIEFEPCEAGILTPALYALDTLDMPLLEGMDSGSGDRKPQDAFSTMPADKRTAEDDKAIVIKMSWVRNAVAVAAAIVAYFLITTPVVDSRQTGVAISSMEIPLVKKESREASVSAIKEKTPHTTKAAQKAATTAEQLINATVNEPKVETQDAAPKTESQEAAPKTESQSVAPTAASQAAAPPADSKADSKATALPPADSKADSKAMAPPSADKAAVVNERGYCIVLASQVSQRNAEAFVEQLRKQGVSDARIYIHNNIRRVVCGQFNTEGQAYAHLRKVHELKDCSEAWVYKVKP